MLYHGHVPGIARGEVATDSHFSQVNHVVVVGAVPVKSRVLLSNTISSLYMFLTVSLKAWCQCHWLERSVGSWKSAASSLGDTSSEGIALTL